MACLECKLMKAWKNAGLECHNILNSAGNKTRQLLRRSLDLDEPKEKHRDFKIKCCLIRPTVPNS